ncbi:hypothetical protein PY364_15100 [Kamptonema sp. UHCC 0994]|nr:hypothetical protein [Kamptonema sp. UHCC 0994]
MKRSEPYQKKFCTQLNAIAQTTHTTGELTHKNLEIANINLRRTM